MRRVLVLLALFTPPLAPAPVAAQLAAPDELWSQDTPGVLEIAEPGDGFGRPAAGDFDGDGFEDLAVGVPFEDLTSGGGPVVNAGGVHVLYGSSGGLLASGDQFFDQNGLAGGETAEDGDSFGHALAAGDFDGDGFDDLAIAAEHESVGAVVGAGAVVVLYGTATGLTAIGQQLWHQDSPNVQGTAEANDQFGNALAVGRFDGDTYDDLAIGVDFEAIGAIESAGAVNVLYGSAAGLTDFGNQLWHQDIAGVADTAETGDLFGWALAAGRFDGDEIDDLAIGVWNEDVGSISNAGAVNVLLGSATGLTAAGDQFWHQDSGTIQGVAEASDHFGHALAAGDFDGDGRADLAVGVPFEDVDGFSDAGTIHVLLGDTSGLTDVGNQHWTQNSPGVPDAAEDGDSFGNALAAGDFDGDLRHDLAVGAWAEGIGAIAGAGAAHVLYGSPSGLTAAGGQLFHQDSPGVGDAAEPGDNFSFYLGAGDFDGDGRDALAVGVPNEDLGATGNEGVVQVLPDTLLFADGFESSNYFRWSSASP